MLLDRSAQDRSAQSARVFTIGHGSRDLQEILDILHCAGIACVADVRSYPMSRRHPAFSSSALSTRLEEECIAYHWLGKTLGGFRKSSSQSPHVALEATGLRGFAEHMHSGVFLEGIEVLLDLAHRHATAILCAERLPQDCHRSLIADHLVMRGIPVVHLIDMTNQAPHRLNKLARHQEGRLIYDRGSTEQLGLKW